MDRVVLGRTGLSVSVAGLGCGGSSRLGQGNGASVDDSIRIVRDALDLGVNYFDTARSYQTEEIVGLALEGRRDEAVISTKVGVHTRGDMLLDGPGLRGAIEDSLGLLRTDSIDVFHLHAVKSVDYDYCVTELVPELIAMRDKGAIRFLALSENFATEFSHEILERAIADDCWDVLMVGFNILNPSARLRTLPMAIASDIGIEVMFAVRNVFSRPELLRKAIAGAVADGLINGETIDPGDPLGFLVHEGGASSIVDAAYRFARHEPGCHVVLTGTGNLEHLRSNVRSINEPPLPDEDLARLSDLFGHLAHFNGN